MSIRLRLTLWYTALLSLVLVGFASLVYVALGQQLANQMEYVIHMQALEASRTAHGASLGLSTARAVRIEPSFTFPLVEGKVYAQLVDPNGRIIASSSDLPLLPQTPTENLRLALGGQESHTTLSLPNERIDLYSAPLTQDNIVVGVLQVAASLQPLETSLGQLRLLLVAIVLVTTLLAGGIGWFLATKAMSPVDRITRTVQEIGRSADLSRRLPVPRERDELGRLAATFNEMLGRLEGTIATQHRFLADASHELRTPLSALRMNAEMLRRGKQGDSGDRDHRLRVIVHETDRMGRLVADLLTLARVEAGQPLVRRRFALDTLLLDVYQQQKAMGDGVQLGIGELEQVEVDGDSDRIKQLLLNLVDNALRYTPPGGTVTLDLINQGDTAMLRVRDTGPGIPPEHLPKIFDRFYRIGKTRSGSPGGTGLGLAICRWVAEAHGGRIEVISEVGIGSTFNVLLPACAGPGSTGAMAPCPPGLNQRTLTLS